MCFNGVVGSRVISSAFMWFCIFFWTPNASSDSGDQEPVRFIVSR